MTTTHPLVSRGLGLGLALILALAAPAWAAVEEPPLALTIDDAIARGLAHNLRALLGEAGAAAARAAELEAVARLRPSFGIDAGGSRQKINLAAFGLAPADGSSPLVGPFDVVDLRLKAAMPLWDAALRRAASAARSRRAAGELDAAEARDLVVLACGNLYLSALAEEGRIEAAAARRSTAEALALLAHDRKAQGAASALDELRAEVELAAAQERQLTAAGEAEKARLALARAIGLAPEIRFTLVDRLAFQPLPELKLEDLVARARDRRADLAAARARVVAAQADLAAARAGRLPALVATADLGEIGPSSSSLDKTYSAGVALRVPIWSGGATAARVAEAEAALAARRAEVEDLERGVDQDVRAALLDLATAGGRVELDRRARELAGRELEVARDRFAVGFASTLDVVAAQEAVASSDEAWLDALYQHNAAKARLARALGIAEEAFAAILQGKLEPSDGTRDHD